MKSITIIGLTVITIVGSSALMADSPVKSDRVLNLSELSEKTIQEFSQGNMSDYILECSAGVSLPFNIQVTGEFLALEEAPPLSLKILKTCYIRCDESENFLFSTDGQTWAGFTDFFMGNLNMSLDAQTKGPVAGLELELNQRKVS